MTSAQKKERIREIKLKIEALIIAIPNEENAYDNYREMAEAYNDKPSKEMFTFLAEEELMHKRKLELLLEKLENELREIEQEDD